MTDRPGRFEDWIRRIGAIRAWGYVAAILVPVAITLLVMSLRLPPFIFEHLIVVLVVLIAIPWGFGPAVVSAIVAVAADDLLLRPPVGQPTVTGVRDLIDLALFAVVAVIVSTLVRRAHVARVAAEAAAGRERAAREERDRLIATITHDLATPLSVLSGTVQFARRAAGGTGQPDLPRLLARLETATSRAVSLVRTLADAQALNTDGLRVERTPLDLRDLVSSVVEMLDQVSARHPVALAAPPEPVPILGDPERLTRVVENLVNNAIKYSPAGGAVEVSITVEGRTATLRVRDYGIGIAPAALPRIFEGAYRAPEAAAHAPGLGLGLSIAAKIVARHDGSIEAEVADGGGALFTVRLPLAPSGAQPAAPAAAGEFRRP